LDEEQIAAAISVLRSGFLANGPEVTGLERDWARYCDVAHAVAVSSGTTALVLAGQALGLSRGDLVLVSGFTFASSANAFLSLGCRVAPVDVDLETMNVSGEALAEALRRHPNSRALVVVDLYGSTAGTGSAITLGRRHGLTVIEDAAQAHGALDDERRPIGGRADATTFSLYATKNLAAGEGGLVTTGRPEVADALRRLRNHGMVEEYRHESVGLNHRLTEVAAAIARSGLPRLDAANTDRLHNARQLAQICEETWGADVVVPPASAPDGRHVFHQFTVSFRTRHLRDSVATRMREAGVDARQFYPYTLRDLPGVIPDATPVADRLRDTVLSFPVHPALTSEQRAILAEVIRSCRVPALR
jgi:dTDP-4-amino-4,6-dideoxygalactose transaminase